MGEKVLEIVIYLIRYLEENGGRLDHIKDMAEDLRSQGFTDNEINSAYMWVIDQYRQPGFMLRSSSKKRSGSYHRVLSEHERNFFTTEAYGTLLQMRHLGIIDDTQFEIIIERAIFSGQDQYDSAMVRTLAWSFIVNNAPGNQSNFNLNGLDYDESSQIH